MSKKLSQTQREVLEYMARGYEIYASIHGGNWLDKIPGEHLYKRVHGNTLYALHKHGYIALIDTARTPWWRRDYEITDMGRKALDECD